MPFWFQELFIFDSAGKELFSEMLDMLASSVWSHFLTCTTSHRKVCPTPHAPAEASPRSGC